MPPTVIWDFDGTLAFRSGWWGDCLVEILDEHEPGHGLEAAVFHPSMQQGFPWHDWEQVREGLDADAWWRPIEAITHRAFATAGLDAERSARYAPLVRSTYLRFERWQLFPDTERALRRLRDAGWRNAILSNHVPELGELVAHLGLAALVDDVWSSAVTGYDKPHPEAFRRALAALGSPSTVWMVGDNPRADVEGAEAVGIPAILIRREGPAARRAPDAESAATMILAT